MLYVGGCWNKICKTENQRLKLLHLKQGKQNKTNQCFDFSKDNNANYLNSMFDNQSSNNRSLFVIPKLCKTTTVTNKARKKTKTKVGSF